MLDPSMPPTLLPYVLYHRPYRALENRLVSSRLVSFTSRFRLPELRFTFAICVVTVTIKWRILAFYRLIFPQKWFRWALLGVAVFVGAWMFTTVFAISFQCIPIEYNWDTTIEGATASTSVSCARHQHPESPHRHGDLDLAPATSLESQRVAPETVSQNGDNAGFLVACIPSCPVLLHRAMGKTEVSKQSNPSSRKKTPGGSGRSDDSRRRPVVSWDRITNTDEIELLSQTPANHRWEPLPEKTDGHYKDGDHASAEIRKEPGVAI
ncbi:uncharacterized protein F4807DRAFT_469838 [Annulohypoxylon truncatum]|uniref:uncharacterized protein n=1 Tax=Annulohypoxylon truncatum TaxID=327061 RepID=UPI0020076DEB|nr:uncharacterized protein F4807DRAFT_469838 [Annulohypoxylon truncatum]KAI1206784.1 hypothetical protein F4807DRAFT_469838 [Annulohypoxylon truncatum]